MARTKKQEQHAQKAKGKGKLAAVEDLENEPDESEESVREDDDDMERMLDCVEAGCSTPACGAAGTGAIAGNSASHVGADGKAEEDDEPSLLSSGCLRS